MSCFLNIILASVGSTGWTVTIVGFSIVAFSLTALLLVFSLVPKLLNMNLRNKLKKKGDTRSIDENDEVPEMEGNVNAAIATALHLYFSELHDDESNIITIKKVQKSYSPWSSKIYTVTNNWPTK
ncbi:hypothetical protein EMN47_12695 [Prolixibacteraceae bacterium JC049]|jgi:Na+-transporting methylmalonyl-CoA/oxaloacetate decarboxylase gamma subunit|nr:hypothetical protein [Prolixibacteraceae bacterium JC049]